VISIGTPLDVLRISNKAANEVMNRHVISENLNLINNTFSSLKPSVKYIRKLCKHFTQKEFPPGTTIYLENQRNFQSVYLIKSGTAELISEKIPLRQGESEPLNGGQKSYITMKNDESFCLGLN
jgi:hypothetical protein